MVHRYELVGIVVLCGALVVAGTGVTPSAGATAEPPTEIDSCTTITKPGLYALAADLDDVKSARISESCIVVRADDVTLRGRGHVVDGKGISDTRGVLVDGARNVTVRNLSVSDWHIGVYYRNASGELRGVTARENAFGIDIDDSRGVTLRGNTVTGNLVGIAVEPNGPDRLVNNRVHAHFVVGVTGAGNETSEVVRSTP